MKIGLSSASFYPDVNTERSIELMKRLGFDSGEIFLNSFCEYEEDFVKILLEEVLKHKFEVISVHAFGSPFEPHLFDLYERRRKDVMKFFNAVCRAASMLGAKYYTFHGMRLGDYRELNKSFIADIYNQLAYTAGENGILLAQENVSWCMSSSIGFLSLINETCSYPIGFTLDIKQAYKAGIEPAKYVEIMRERLVNVHLNDRDDKSVCLLPGKGKVDFREFFNKLNISGYRGNGIIEVYKSNYTHVEELEEARHHLEEVRKEVF